MKKFQAKDLARNTADLWTAATVAPVAITKHRKARFVVMSVERYEELLGSEASRVSVDFANMPNDKGAGDHFGGK